MKKEMLIALMLLVSIAPITAISDLGTFKDNEPIELVQTCSDCTFNNVSSIGLPNGSVKQINKQMNKDGSTYTYTWDEGNTTQLGVYNVNGIGDPSGSNKVWSYTFQVTPSGNDSNEWFYILIFALTVGLGSLGFFRKYPWVSLLGGLGSLGLAVYITTQGIIIYQDFITEVVTFITFGVGAIYSLVPVVEFIQTSFSSK